jgi:hypothetical protein
LKEVFDKYIATRSSLKPTTIADYERVMYESFEDWKKKPLLDITKDMVARRHAKFGERSHARANLGMRLLKRLSQSRAWFRVERRQGYIVGTKPQLKS